MGYWDPKRRYPSSSLNYQRCHLDLCILIRQCFLVYWISLLVCSRSEQTSSKILPPLQQGRCPILVCCDHSLNCRSHLSFREPRWPFARLQLVPELGYHLLSVHLVLNLLGVYPIPQGAQSSRRRSQHACLQKSLPAIPRMDCFLVLCLDHPLQRI